MDVLLGSFLSYRSAGTADKARTSRTPSIKLPAELLVDILEYLHASSPKSLLNVALSSSSFYNLAKKQIHSSICFYFTRAKRASNRALINSLLTDEDLCKYVRKLHVCWAPNAVLQAGEDGKKDLELLRELMPKLEGLQVFFWDAQYSILPWLLEDLHKQSPHCRLYARYPSSQHTQPQLGNLFNSSCLSFLDIQSTCLSYADLYVIQNAAASCPNLESLAITSERADPDTLPALADKYASQTKPMKLKSFEIDGCGLAEDWHAFWESCLDWPSLERLSLSNSWILHSQPISAQLSNLKSLRLWRLDHTIEKSVLKVLESLSNLEQLDYNGRIDQIISRHGLFKHLGKTLTSLRLHQDGHRDDDPNEDFDKRYTLTSDDLRCISGTCPRLRAFGFDMMSFNKHSSVSVPETDPTRPFNSPEKMLECVAHLFWFLEHIEFNLEIKYQERRHGRWKSPTLQLAEMLWEMLRHGIRESRIQKGHEITEPRLRFLDVVAGSFFPISDQDNLRPLRRWEAQEQQRFQVNLAERNDEATRDVAKVRCVELEALKARIGTDASTRNWYQNALMDAVVDRATKGPTGKRQEHIVMDRELMRSSPFWDQHDEQRFYFR